MPASFNRANFIRKDFRVVKNANASMDALYGSWARKTDEPIPSSLVHKEDAQAVVDARPALLNNGRRMSWEVGGEETGMAMNYLGVCPAAQAIDDERRMNGSHRIDEIQINFFTGRTILETWGENIFETNRLRLSGDMSDGNDVLLLSGDMQSGFDGLALSETGNEPGYDIILLCGQSNMVGRSSRIPSLDKEKNRVSQFGGFSPDQSTYRKIVKQIYPLRHRDNHASPRNFIGLGEVFGKHYASSLSPERQVLLVPTAVGNTGLTLGDENWSSGAPGGVLYENAISQAEAALASALAVMPTSRIVGIAWHQGENDAYYGVSYAAYLSALNHLIDGFRNRLNAPSSWFVIGGMVPELISGSAAYGAIRDAHAQAATDNKNTYYIDGPAGQTFDGVHYTASGYRTLGGNMASAVS